MKIKWSPRLKQEKLLRLYKSNALHMTDRDLLHDVAITLYLRCKAIIAVHGAHYKEIISDFLTLKFLTKLLSEREKQSYVNRFNIIIFRHPRTRNS